MNPEFTVKVEVVDASGNATFTLTVPATKDELILPDHATPGVNMVLAHLVKATAPQHHPLSEKIKHELKSGADAIGEGLGEFKFGGR